jgi:AmmeMemoRadiSam system protein A
MTARLVPKARPARPSGRPADASAAAGASMAVPRPVSIAPDEQAALLRLARTALAVVTGQTSMGPLDDALRAAATFAEPAAVFVTLTEDGELRGCMGGLVAERPIAEAVLGAACTAALRDPRFVPLSARELPGVRIEISVLGSAVPLDVPAHLRAGIDGVIVERGPAVALLLPEVADHFDWGGREMVEAACRKAGLPADAWRDERTRLSVFRTARFGGPAVATPEPGDADDQGVEPVLMGLA